MRRQALVGVMLGLCGALVGGFPVGAAAQTYRADDIVNHFKPAAPVAGPAFGSTRGLGPTRGLCVGTEAECDKAGHAVKPATPASAFDLVVRFKYNSDVLEPDAKVNLDEFAKALKDPRLVGSRFFVDGHTDASGTAPYNLDLSRRRSQAVVRYLSEKGVDAAKLQPRGFGQTRPIAPDPLAGDNRRVETRIQLD